VTYFKNSFILLRLAGASGHSYAEQGYLEICPFYSGNYGRVDVLGLTLAVYHTYRYSLSVEYLNVVYSVHNMTASKHCADVPAGAGTHDGTFAINAGTIPLSH
jgi:hypothetical protein